MNRLADRIDVPVYLGCDWDNVGLHLPSTFVLWSLLEGRVPLRMGMLGAGGMTWHWESLHVEALAWFDHRLKGADTGIMAGPAVRYVMPGAGDVREAESWPPPSKAMAWALWDDGRLSADDPGPGSTGEGRAFRFVPESMPRAKGAPAPTLRSSLSWESAPLTEDLEIAGRITLELTARLSAPGTHLIAGLFDVDPDGSARAVTAGVTTVLGGSRLILPVLT